MVVLQSFSTALQSVGRRPTLAVPAAVLATISVASTVSQGSLWSLVTSLLSLLVTPFVMAGFIALVDDARTGGRRDADFFAAGRHYFLTLLGGNLLVGLVMVVIGGIIVAAGVAVLGGFAAVLGGDVTLTPVTVAIVGVLAVVGWLVSLLFRFFAPAAVVEDRRVGSAIGRSVEVVTDNFLAVVGFALFSGLVSLVLNFGPMWYFVFDATTVDGVVAAVQAGYPGATAPVALVVLFLTSTVSTLLLQSYLVCFFGACTRRAHDG
ncbi:DUF7847 domain-containing protein [Halogranum amylolyticum]|nr:hypothetical protein [Halogranum amylolyticum]